MISTQWIKRIFQALWYVIFYPLIQLTVMCQHWWQLTHGWYPLILTWCLFIFQTIPQAHSEMVTLPPSISQTAFYYLLCGRINTFPHRRHIKNFYTSLLLPFLFSLQNILLPLPLITTQFYHLSRLSANTTSSLISLLPAEFPCSGNFPGTLLVFLSL